MATNLNNVHTSSFNKGMNSDTSYDMVGDGQYIFGLNIRITLNSLLRAVTDSNSTEGIVTPVNAGEEVSTEGMYTDNKIQILATASIEDVGAVIVSSGNKWKLYRIDFDKNPIKFSLLFESEEYEKPFNRKFSVVINKEINDVVKLYIADGIHQLMQVNLLDDEYNSKISGNTDNITSNRLYPSLLTKILKQISGLLKTSQILYTYRFYKKYGIYSKLAPLTSKILIIDNNRNKEEGNAEDTRTSMGLLVQIPIKDLNINDDVFDHVLLFRLLYIRAQEDAHIQLIYDAKIEDSETLTIDDNGLESLRDYSIDEFSSMKNMSLIPQNIEQNQNYMFISNIKDETMLRMKDYAVDVDSKTYRRRGYVDNGDSVKHKFVLKNNKNVQQDDDIWAPTELLEILQNESKKDYDVNPTSLINRKEEQILNWENCRFALDNGDYYYGGEGKNINWKFVTTEISLHENFSNYTYNPPASSKRYVNNNFYYIKDSQSGNQKKLSTYTTNDYLNDHGIECMNSKTYDDIVCSSMFRSLRRDEVYRYGVVYYDKYGRRSDVLWIGDLRTPSEKESPSFDVKEFSTGKHTQTLQIKSNIIYHWDTSDGMFTGSYVNRYGPFYIETTGELLFEIDSVWLAYKTSKVSFSEFERLQEGAQYRVFLITGGHTLQRGQRVRVSRGQEFYIHINPIERSWYEEYPTPLEYPLWKEVHMHNDIGGGEEEQWKLKMQSLAKNLLLKEGYPEEENPYGYNDYGFNSPIEYNINISVETVNDIYNTLVSNPMGIEFNISVPKTSGIDSFLIVRCAKHLQYSRLLLQCCLSRPISQPEPITESGGKLDSPYYPIPFLHYGRFRSTGFLKDMLADNNDNSFLFQMFSPEIDLFPNDSLALVQNRDSFFHALNIIHDNDLSSLHLKTNAFRSYAEALQYDNGLSYTKHLAYGSSGGAAINLKEGSTCFFTYYKRTNINNDLNTYADILSSSLVHVPTWESGFSNIQLSGSKIISGVKSYKSYISSILDQSYVNWISNGMYDLRLTGQQSQNGIDDSTIWGKRTKAFTYLDSDNTYADERSDYASGWIGAGPRCILARTDDKTLSIFSKPHELPTLCTLTCNVEHTARQFAGVSALERLFDTYYGFGNFCKLQDDGNETMSGKIVVFDGDSYLMPCEIVTMYKAYNFNSIKDFIPSSQVVNYVPMLTKINTFFDYGMNYRNTQSVNLQIEPGEITGVATQERPLHQYNPIYSDNNISNDVYNALHEDDEDQTFTQRIYYSLLKINGEHIDNWSDFRALDYIDADTRYGEITHMLTRKDIIYFWQTSAFGKLSVNERSLVTDNNSNTILLGQGGVLLRTDYIDTKHGIRKDDRSAISTNDGLFWIDVYNKAVLGNANDQVVNYGERLNVQNTLNERMTVNLPYIEYDGLNLELLCKCLEGGDQIVFNTKLNCSTGIYTRDYVDTILHRNTVYGISNKLVKYNNLIDDDNAVYLSPVILKFSVNQNYSTTKVFDTQQIITMKRDYDENFAKDFMKDKLIEFETNLGKSEYRYNPNEVITDRESNLTYSIPRQNNSDYGNRLRGRWMTVSITDNNPKYDFAISHVLTKYRQSFV